MKRIILTGGGTAGHVNPNIALLPGLKDAGYDIIYVGSHEGIEKDLITPLGIPYYGISTGKLRRYMDAKNITDAVRVVKGLSEATKLLQKLKPDIVFSKGGYVSVPVVRAAKKLHIPAILHESDFTPGLANKISFRYAQKICCSFPETMSFLPADKAVLTGTPIRKNLSLGNKEKGLAFCGFDDQKPVIMIMGGSTGSVFINNTLRSALPQLLTNYQIVHLCGKGKLDASFSDLKGYVQYEYIRKELADVLACASLVISRAGANALFELLSLQKPHILIPLSIKGSRGDQILNASSFEHQGFSCVLEENRMTEEIFVETIAEVMENMNAYIDAMHNYEQKDAAGIIIRLIEDTCR